MDKTKGHIQVFWERKFMYTSKYICTYYTLLGLEDNYDNTIIDKRFRELMWNFVNFIKEETQLQTNALKIGKCRGHIVINRIPKCRPKLSSEGIEYSRGCVINYYRQL